MAAAKMWECMECERRMTFAAAERIAHGGRCRCGGTDIDLMVEYYCREDRALHLFLDDAPTQGDD